jgi:hypothetical protein
MRCRPNSRVTMCHLNQANANRVFISRSNRLYGFMCSQISLMEWRAGMEPLSPSTINVRLSAVRKMIGEARKNGMLGAEETAA